MGDEHPLHVRSDKGSVSLDRNYTRRFPHLAAEWHPTRNGLLTLETAPLRNSIWWRCTSGHEWQQLLVTRLDTRSARPGCRECRLAADRSRSPEDRGASRSRPYSELAPHLVAEWHPTRNGDLTLDTAHSQYRAWWRCSAGHEWDAKVAGRVHGGSGCPECRRLRQMGTPRPSKTKGVIPAKRKYSQRFPHLLLEWHPELNGELTLDTAPSLSRPWWICASGHEWQAQLSSRACGAGCPRCRTPHSSRVERQLAAALGTVLTLDTQDQQVVTDGSVLHCDVLDRTRRLVVEFDGGHWHRDSEDRDRRKTERLEAEGWTVLRVREAPLQPVSTLSVPAVHKEDPFLIAERVVARLNEEGWDLAVPTRPAGPVPTTPLVDQQWNRSFALLEATLSAPNWPNVLHALTLDGTALGAWCYRQRKEYHAGTLSPERVAHLEALSGWNWFPFGPAIQPSLDALHAFVEREGHADVPSPHREQGLTLGRWVTKQRAMREQGLLPPDLAEHLESLPGWTWEPRRERSSSQGTAAALEALQAFVAREGHARVLQAHREEGSNLGSWVKARRQDRARGTLSDDLIRQLEAFPGWAWNAREAAWEDRFAALVRYATSVGTARPPSALVWEGLHLGQWVGVLRSRRDQMTPERRTRLEALPGWTWNSKETAWEDSYALLVEYATSPGGSGAPRQDLVWRDVALGAWVSHQRTLRAKHSPERTALLEAVPGWLWNGRDRSC